MRTLFRHGLLLTVPVIALVITLAPVSVMADAVVLYSGDDGNTDARSAFVQNGKVLIKDTDDPNTDIVFQPDINTMFVINHAEQTIMRIDEQAIDQFAEQAGGMASMIQQQIQQQMAGMTDEQKAQMEAMLGGMMPGMNTQPQEPEPVTLVETGSAQYAGFACTVNQVMRSGNIIGQVCFSMGNNLGLSNGDYQTLVGMQNFTFLMASKADQFSGMLGGNVPSFGNIETNNLIIQGTNAQNENNSMNIEAISNEGLPAGTTDLPTGYVEETLPSLSDLM